MSSITTRAIPLRYWLPRSSFTGSVPTATGAFAHAYVASSKSRTRRNGPPLSSLRYLGAPDVVISTVTASP